MRRQKTDHDTWRAKPNRKSTVSIIVSKILMEQPHRIVRPVSSYVGAAWGPLISRTNEIERFPT